MPISINGSGSITGVSVGGLPDGSVTIADLASDAKPGKVLLGTYTATNATNLDLTGWYQSQFDEYELEIFDTYPINNSVVLNLNVSTDNGSTFDTGANYDYATFFVYGSSQSGQTTAVSQTSWVVSTGGIPNTSNYAVIATVKLSNPASSLYKTMVGTGHQRHVTLPGPALCYFGGTWKSTSAYNALRLSFSSGNITGIARIYGLAK